MGERFNNIGFQFGQAWQLMSVGQRVIISILALGLIGAIVFFGVWGSSPQYEMAVANLSEEEAAAVVASLRENAIPYRLSSNGRAILVPSGQTAEVRLQLAGEGLPSDGRTGFELFDQANFGMTEEVQRINYQRALEGELARTLRRIEAVQDARVHVVLPQQGLFSSKKTEAAASVVLSLKPGRELGEGQIEALINLLTGSIEGLKPERLSIIDSRGRTLTSAVAGIGGGGLNAAASQTQQKRRYEAELAAGLTEMLAQIVGIGKAVVNAQVSFNWDQTEIQREEFEPKEGSGVVRSRQEQTEVSTTPGTAGVGGVPGTASNVPTYQTTNGQTGNVGYERRETLTNYELTKTVERTQRAPGTITQVAIAVLLDGQSLPEDLSLEAVQELVATAAGLDSTRGDRVTITKASFNAGQPELAAQAFEQTEQREMVLDLAQTGGLALTPVLLLALLAFFLRRSFRPVGQPTRRQMLPRALAAEEPAAPIPILEDPQTRAVRQQVSTLAKDEPAMVSALINTWLDEDRR